MFDKAALFTDLTKRNALRRAAKLPLLDIKAELSRQAESMAWQEAVRQHEADLVDIRGKVLAELQATRGPDFDTNHSAGARWLIEATVNKRFADFLVSLGFTQPKPRLVYSGA